MLSLQTYSQNGIFTLVKALYAFGPIGPNYEFKIVHKCSKLSTQAKTKSIAFSPNTTVFLDLK